MDTIELSSAQLCNANNSFSIVVVVVCFGYPREIQKGGKTRKVAYYIFVVCTHHQLFHRLLMMNLLLSIERLWF